VTEWLKLYIGGLITDISAHKAMIEAQGAEIERLKANPDVPDGWMLVPKEATAEMLGAPIHEADGCDARYQSKDDFRAAWEAMLGAAPEWPVR
jgi:hypothetical protein